MLHVSPVLVTPRDLDPAGLERVEEELTAQVDRRAADLVAVDPALHGPVARLRDVVAGGKRLRAAFCLWGARAAGQDPDGPDGTDVPGVHAAAAALEMFHVAALVHDDVMDRSDRRRGVPTIHRAFADHHADRAWDGVARDFGDGVAVLLGDLCLTWSDDLFAAAYERAALTGSTAARAARTAWEEMRTQVIAGQYLDLLGQARPADGAAAERVLVYKSAKYTVEHPLAIGAALGGADRALVDGLRRVGLAVGEAFQLRDDVLGVFGDPDATGKPVSDDVREGKRTLLVTFAEERASARQRAVLDRSLGDRDLGADGLDRVREVLVASGALGRVEERIEERMAEAHDVLGATTIDPHCRRMLGALSDACAWRAA